jgi:glycosyltransferase involved in cell wall biosynthesis
LVSPRPLSPIRHGHVLRTRQLARALVEAGHRVLALELGTVGGPHPDSELKALGVERYGVPWARGPAAVWGTGTSWLRGAAAQVALFDASVLKGMVEPLASRADLVVLTLVRLSGLLQLFQGVPVVFDLVDSLAFAASERVRWDRPWLRFFWRIEAKRLGQAERRAIEESAESWLVSPRDREWLLGRVGDGAKARIRWVPVVCERTGEGNGGSFRKGPNLPHGFRLAVTGNLGYFPTRHGLSKWLQTTWPRVRRAFPEVSLLLAGSRLPRRWRRFAMAWVEEPADLRAVLPSASAAVVPLWTGAGVPLKMLEAWACGVPIVATPWAARGAGGVAGADHLEADGPESWVEALQKIRSDPGTVEQLCHGGWTRLEQDWSWRALTASLSASKLLRC